MDCYLFLLTKAPSSISPFWQHIVKKKQQAGPLTWSPFCPPCPQHPCKQRFSNVKTGLPSSLGPQFHAASPLAILVLLGSFNPFPQFGHQKNKKKQTTPPPAGHHCHPNSWITPRNHDVPLCCYSCYLYWHPVLREGLRTCTEVKAQTTQCKTVP